jgi:hypothetical protein
MNRLDEKTGQALLMYRYPVDLTSPGSVQQAVRLNYIFWVKNQNKKPTDINRSVEILQS